MTLGAALAGGIYDAADYAWTVSGGTLTGAATATPVWTRPQVNADGDFTISLTDTDRGTGGVALNGTDDTDSDTETATVRNVAVIPNASSPTVSIDAVPNGNSGTDITLGVALTGGVYDALDYAWTVSGGSLDNATAAAPVWTRPTVTADTDYTISLTVTARGTGTNAANNTSAMASDTETATVQPAGSAPTPDVSLWNDPRRWYAGELVDAALLNRELRDQFLAIQVHAHGPLPGSRTLVIDGLTCGDETQPFGPGLPFSIPADAALGFRTVGYGNGALDCVAGDHGHGPNGEVRA